MHESRRPNSPQKPTSRRPPPPPAEPARSARDGRRHAACNSLRQNLSFLAASGAPLVRSHVNAACSLASDPLGGRLFPLFHVSSAHPGPKHQFYVGCPVPYGVPRFSTRGSNRQSAVDLRGSLGQWPTSARLCEGRGCSTCRRTS